MSHSSFTLAGYQLSEPILDAMSCPGRLREEDLVRKCPLHTHVCTVTGSSPDSPCREQVVYVHSRRLTHANIRTCIPDRWTGSRLRRTYASARMLVPMCASSASSQMEDSSFAYEQAYIEEFLTLAYPVLDLYLPLARSQGPSKT